jgi:hypothetical protein
MKALSEPLDTRPRLPGVPTPPLESEEITVAAPMSYHGSPARLWTCPACRALVGPQPGACHRLEDHSGHTLVVLLIVMAWLVIKVWYVAAAGAVQGGTPRPAQAED